MLRSPAARNERMDELPYLTGYPPATLASVHRLIADGRLAAYLAQKYPRRHELQSDTALQAHVSALKAEYLRSAPPLHRVSYEGGMEAIRRTLGVNLRTSRVQGGRLKAKREIRIASVFREAAPEFLDMIAVHELAHLREADHDKAFYRLCEHMLPDYHQLEFDTRLWLLHRRLGERTAPSAA
ncbi:MAG: M48 family metallopeptidase [Nevskia sp.]